MGEARVGGHFLFQLFSLLVFHFLFQITQPVFHINQVLFCLKHFLIDRQIAGQILMLRQIAQGLPLGQNYLPAVGDKFTYNNFQKRRFSRTVDSDKRCLFPFFYMKGSIIQNFVGSERLCNILTC